MWFFLQRIKESSCSEWQHILLLPQVSVREMEHHILRACHVMIIIIWNRKLKLRFAIGLWNPSRFKRRWTERHPCFPSEGADRFFELLLCDRNLHVLTQKWQCEHKKKNLEKNSQNMKCEFGFFLTDHISATASEFPLTAVELWLIRNTFVGS